MQKIYDKLSKSVIRKCRQQIVINNNHQKLSSKNVIKSVRNVLPKIVIKVFHYKVRSKISSKNLKQRKFHQKVSPRNFIKIVIHKCHQKYHLKLS